MKNLKFRTAFLVITLSFATLAGPAMAADYPTDIITWNFGMKPGGGQDGATRLLAKLAGEVFGQKIIVKNRAGAGGAVSATFVKSAKPDGYNIGVGFTVTTSFDPHVKKLKFKADDFTYITTMARLNLAFLSVTDGRWTDFAGMIAWAKKTGKPLNYGTNTTLDRMIVKAIAKKENIKINLLPMKGGGPGKAALMGGHVDFGILGSSHFATAKENKLQILVMLNSERNDAYPDIPTLKNLGYNLAYDTWTMFYGPKGLPKDIVAKLAQGIHKAASQQEFKDLITKKLGAHYGLLGPEELGKRMKTWNAEYQKLAQSVK